MTTRTVSLKEGQAVLRRLQDQLAHNEELEDIWARAILDQAQGVAAGKPTPQARMAAEGMGVQRGTILSLSGGPPEDVAAGSEFGSSLYRQFGPRNTRGYWLLPSAEAPSPGTIAQGEKWLDEQVEDSIRGF